MLNLMKIEVVGLLPELKTQFVTAVLVDCDATPKPFRGSLEVAAESLMLVCSDTSKCINVF